MHILLEVSRFSIIFSSYLLVPSYREGLCSYLEEPTGVPTYKVSISSKVDLASFTPHVAELITTQVREPPYDATPSS